MMTKKEQRKKIVTVVGQGRKGLKQIHDISGTRVNAYSVAGGSNNEHHISIRGTDLQISDALILLGKQIAQKKVRLPKTKTGPPKDSSKPAPLLKVYRCKVAIEDSHL